eukprot:9560434-Alexandrium_andersonii.AAC.1
MHVACITPRVSGAPLEFRAGFADASLRQSAFALKSGPAQRLRPRRAASRLSRALPIIANRSAEPREISCSGTFAPRP